MNEIEKAIEDMMMFSKICDNNSIKSNKDTEEMEISKKLKLSCDLAISALEKQVPKKAIETYELGYICPSCKGGMIYSPNVIDNKHEDCNYCNECGQKLDWSEVQE